MIEVGNGRVCLWWGEVVASVGSPTVAVPRVGGQHCPQVSLTEDQHTVRKLGSRGEHKPFGETVRPRTLRRDLHHLDTGISQNGVERGAELTCPIPDEDTELGSAVPERSVEVVVIGSLDKSRTGGLTG
jgi:hypothetical protein